MRVIFLRRGGEADKVVHEVVRVAGSGEAGQSGGGAEPAGHDDRGTNAASDAVVSVMSGPAAVARVMRRNVKAAASAGFDLVGRGARGRERVGRMAGGEFGVSFAGGDNCVFVGRGGGWRDGEGGRKTAWRDEASATRAAT